MICVVLVGVYAQRTRIYFGVHILLGEYRENAHCFSLKLNWKRSFENLSPLWPENTNIESRATASAKFRHVGGMSPICFTLKRMITH